MEKIDPSFDPENYFQSREFNLEERRRWQRELGDNNGHTSLFISASIGQSSYPMSAQSVVLQEFTPLRDSVIWDLQDQFYIRKGPSCWTDAIVPHFVTSNSYIAYQYANCILGYIRDYYNRYGCYFISTVVLMRIIRNRYTL